MWDEGDAATRRGEYESALRQYEAARRVTEDGEARWYVHTAQCSLYRGEFEAGIHRAGAGLRQRWATGPLGAQLLAVRALCHAAAGRPGLGAADVEQARAQPELDAATRAMIERAAGTVALVEGDAAAAYTAFLRAHDDVDETDTWRRSIAQYNLAEASFELGELTDAHRYLDLAEAAKREANDVWGLAYLHRVRARCCLAVGSIVEAIASCRLGLMFAQRIDDPRIQSALLVTLGQLAALNGDFATARRAGEQGVSLARRCNAIPELIAATLSLAEADLLAGELPDAMGRARWAHAHATAHGLERGVALGGLTEVLASFRPTEALIEAALGHASALANPFERMEAEVRLLWWQARHGMEPAARDVGRLLAETKKRGAMRLHALCRVTKAAEVAGECEATLRLLGCDPEADQVGAFAEGDDSP
ncbi:MAG: hypothetical protein AAF721_35010 [Myxococcota bacterium]